MLAKWEPRKFMKKKVSISLLLLRDVVKCKLYYEGDSHVLHNTSSKTDLIYNSNPIRFYESWKIPIAKWHHSHIKVTVQHIIHMFVVMQV